jgi:hypothetical protein
MSELAERSRETSARGVLGVPKAIKLKHAVAAPVRTSR